MNEVIEQKYADLEQQLKAYEKAVVAFSAGTDSALLLYAAKSILKDQVIAVTSHPLFFPEEEISAAAEFCRQYNIRHIICSQDTAAIEQLRYNPQDRCYICKKSFYSEICRIAREKGIQYVLDGSIVDDDNDYRPSRKALRELDIKTPLYYAGFSKEEVRSLSKELGLPTWNKHSMACYATRFPYGTLITQESLRAVKEGEKYLLSLGFSMARVRHHDSLVRLELLHNEIGKLLQNDLLTKVDAFFHELGYQYVTVDLKGYAAGSMNLDIPSE